MAITRQRADGMSLPDSPSSVADASRRRFFRLGLGALSAALGADAAKAAVSGVPGSTDAVRIAHGPHTLDSFPAWFAADAGLVPAPGLALIDTSDSPLDTLLRGDCEFAQAGVTGIARAVLEGRDPVLVLSPVDPHRAGALFSRNDLRSPRELANARVGVPGESGASAISARAVMQNFGIVATLVPLGSSAAAYTALAERRVDAAYLPVELGFRGRHEFGWNMFEGGMLGVPGGLVTTRRFAAMNPLRVTAVLAGVVEAIHRFRTRPESTSLALQRYLKVDHLAIAGDLQALYSPIFRATPAPSLFFGLAGLRRDLATRYPHAGGLQPADLVDGSFVDSLVRNGFIERLYRESRDNIREGAAP